MNKLIVALAALLVVTTLGTAQQLQTVPGKEVKNDGPRLVIVRVDPVDPVAPTLDDYESVLKHYKIVSKKITDPAAWKGTEMVNKNTKDVVLFEKLSKFEQAMFLVGSGQKLAVEMKSFDGHWQAELKKFDNPKYEPKKGEKSTGKDAPALKKDVEGYLKELTTIRKDTAVAYEKYVNKVFEEFKEEIPAKERELHLKQIREFNDENKLIERKK